MFSLKNEKILGSKAKLLFFDFRKRFFEENNRIYVVFQYIINYNIEFFGVFVVFCTMINVLEIWKLTDR